MDCFLPLTVFCLVLMEKIELHFNKVATIAEVFVFGWVNIVCSYILLLRILALFGFLFLHSMEEVDGEVIYQFCLSDSLKQSWRNGSRSVQRCGECFIVLRGAVNARDFAAVKRALNEFQHFNILQVPNCTNLRSLAIQYLLNNSILYSEYTRRRLNNIAGSLGKIAAPSQSNSFRGPT